jgi:hypothetical protein
MSRLFFVTPFALLLTLAAIAEARIPAPPTDLPGLFGPTSWVPTWTLTGFTLHTEDPAGPLTGGGASLEFMLSPYLGFEGSLAGLGGEAAEGDATLSRDGLRVGGAVVIYPMGLRGRGVNPYVRGGLVEQRMEYMVALKGAESLRLDNRSSFGEIAAGVRLLLGHRGDAFALSLTLEAAALFPDDSQSGDVTVEHDEPSMVLRAGLGLHF